MSKAAIQATQTNVTRLLTRAGYVAAKGNTTGFMAQKTKEFGDKRAVYVMPFVQITGSMLDAAAEMQRRNERAAMLLAYEGVLTLRYRVQRRRNKVGNGYLVISEKAAGGAAPVEGAAKGKDE